MEQQFDASAVARELTQVRQIRQYRPDPVPDDVLEQVLEVARWTGSSRNTQPWHLIVLDDPEQRRRLSRLRDAINWVAGAPLAIAIVLDGRSDVSEAYDEGRLTERMLDAARFFGVGGGTAWYGDADQQRAAREILGVPDGRVTRSLVALGYPVTAADPRPGPVEGGRKPLSELVSRNTLQALADS